MNSTTFRGRSWILDLLLGFSAVAAVVSGGGLHAARASTPALMPVTAYRSASCGCCKGWLQHMRANGFTVRDVVVALPVFQVGSMQACLWCSALLVGLSWLVSLRLPFATATQQTAINRASF